MKNSFTILILMANIAVANTATTFTCNVTHHGMVIPLTERQVLSMGESAKASMQVGKIRAKVVIDGVEIELKYFDTDHFGFDLYMTHEGADMLGFDTTNEGGEDVPNAFIESATPAGSVKLWYKCR
ncbi:hypothetical protein JWV37_09605 [Sulfurospirillum sp. T05]|uniref:Uncharacterized protein n=1 Tax=Sulfurospirillum tamanense TaxID=2813362 RepID=A0ABS2WTR1_9BACT|nr:hypothetical protein [Sulfurospirillum tamanensis]MBN2965035.1 hypothetical protein [Sulfurospirillum tamanensis]